MSVETLGNEIHGDSYAQRPFLYARLQNSNLACLFDTGAAVCCISTNWFNSLTFQTQPKRIPGSKDLISASKDKLEIKGVFAIKVEILGRTVTHPFYVINNMNQNAIIGIDLIAKLGLVYMASTKQFIFESDINFKGKDAFKTTARRSGGVIASLTNDKEISFPPLTEIIVQLNCVAAQVERSTVGVTAVANIFFLTISFAVWRPSFNSNKFRGKNFYENHKL